MKSLEDYINDKNNIFLNECCVYEMFFNNNILNNDYKYIFEKLGLYNGCEDTASLITHNIDLNKVNKEKFTIRLTNNDFKNIDNIFFKEIFLNVNIIDIDYNAQFAKYGLWDESKSNEYDSLKYDGDNEIFNFILIDIYLNSETIFIEFDSNYIKNILIHELNHAWKDYNRYKNGVGSLRNIMNNTYINASKRNIVEPSIERFIKNFLYITSEIEKDSYKAQILSIVKKNSKGCNTFTELYQKIKDNKLIKSFIELNKKYNEYIDNKDTWNIIVKLYNKLNNTNYEQQKVYSILSNLYNKFKKKLISQLVNTYYENKNIYMIQ